VYNINRQEAADILGISTRSIDRYIKSWKIRAKKDWKIVFVNSDDIKNLNSGNRVKQKIIISDNTNIPEEFVINWVKQARENMNTWIVKKAEYEKILSTFEKMYSGFREEIKEKDSRIQEMAVKLWRAEEQKDNSVDLIEYKKVQFLSEEAKNELSKKLDKEKDEKQRTISELKYEKTTNKLLIMFIVILFIISGVIFFVNI
jgi:predicted transcriptional regulator